MDKELTVGERTRRAIRSQWPPLTMRAVAERMNISEFTLSHYLAGRRHVPDGFWPAVAAAIGCDPSEILSTSEEAVA